MTDREIVAKLITNDQRTINNFFFVRCKPMLAYVGQYFCPYKQSAEELVGEFYELLAADDWHKLRIFKFTCTLNSYVTIIASRYFQNKRNKEMASLDDCMPFIADMVADDCSGKFFMEDLHKIMKRMNALDRFLVQRILIDGEKPGDILDEARELMAGDDTLGTKAETDTQFAGYIYTRYNRVKKGLQKQMVAIGYGK